MAEPGSESEAAIEAIARLVPAVLRGLHALEFAGRNLSPANLPRLVEALKGRDDDLAPALQASRAAVWPQHLGPARDCIERAAAAVAGGTADLLAALEAPEPLRAAYRALRRHAEAAAAIYPMAAHLEPVSHFFLEAPARGDAALAARLAASNPMRKDTGVIHVGGPPGARGAFSLYVPEYYDAARPWPLVAALHGGSGNGGAFLWSWLREARTRGAIVLSPTAAGSTWSLMEPEIDGANIERMLTEVSNHWNVDPARRLLTGMSDGGTFAYVYGLRGDCPFTHLAPVAASFHPLIMEMADGVRLRGLPVRIVHGTQDWMFPPEMAQMAHRVLESAGAAVVYREIGDLSHTYPRDENSPMLEWFLS